MPLDQLSSLFSSGITANWKLVAAGLVAGTGVSLWAFMQALRYRSKSRSPYMTHYEKDKVYLFQFPSCGVIVNISPFAMKVETFLRLHKINYEVVPSVQRWSCKGQIPFIEFNGQEMADSNFILEFLKDTFRIDEELSPEQRAVTRAFEMMLDNQTTWSTFYYRYVIEAKQFVASWTFVGRIFRGIIAYHFPGAFHKRSTFHGIGRNTPQEIVHVGCKDWRAVSEYLGEKKFMFGEQLHELDCFVFAHLSQILDVPMVEYPHREFLHVQCSNLIPYHRRVKEALWPDWDAVCRNNQKHRPLP